MMSRTRVKICGVTTRDDALAACEAGADAVGLILYAPASPRQIDANTAREIAMAMPPFVSIIGVTVDCPPTRVRQLLAHIPLSAIQMHGKESLQDLRSIQPTGAIKKLTAGTELHHEVQTWAKAIVPNLRALLIDSAGGGSGVENDWSMLEPLFGHADRAAFPPLVLAGGLRPQNVGDVVRRFAPWAVDVSSGVEESPGRKSAKLMREFVKAVRQGESK